MDCSLPGSSVHGILQARNSSGKNTGVGYHSLLQGIFPTQGSNPGLLHCRQTLLPSEPPEKSKPKPQSLQWPFRSYRTYDHLTLNFKVLQHCYPSFFTIYNYYCYVSLILLIYFIHHHFQLRCKLYKASGFYLLAHCSVLVASKS